MVVRSPLLVFFRSLLIYRHSVPKYKNILYSILTCKLSLSFVSEWYDQKSYVKGKIVELRVG